MKIKSIYFIGIGGIGMSAIARMLLLDPPSQSFGEERRIMGSDRAKSVVTEELEKLGVKIFYQQVAKNISADIDLVIYTIAISEDNPELKKAKRNYIVLIQVCLELLVCKVAGMRDI